MARARNRRRRPGLRRRLSILWRETTDPLRQRLREIDWPRPRLPKIRLPEIKLLRRRRKPTSEIVRAAEQMPDLSERGLDLVLLATTLALVGTGLVMVFSASAVFAGQSYQDPMYFLKRDLVYIAVGLGALYLGWRIDYHRYQWAAYPILIGALVLLSALLIPGVGTRVDGAVRWFRLAGLSFQPSEPAKFALIVYLAYSLAKKRNKVRSFSVGFLPLLCVSGLMAALVLKEPDLGNAAIMLAITLLLLMVAGTKLSYVMIAVLSATPVAYQLIVGTPWRLRRLLAFLDPWAYRKDAGYQVAESLISIGSGGLGGLGLGAGKQKLFFLPAAHTDFIFAIIGEELGLVGLGAVVLLFGILLWRGLRAGIGARDLFGGYLAFGITALISLQALMHMAVVLGLVPTKGITLPLVSYGGSALITNLFCIGVMLNVAARKPLPAPRKVERQAHKNRRRATRVVIAGEG